MDKLNALRDENPGSTILSVTDETFSDYGRLITGLNAAYEIAIARENIQIGSRIKYEPSVPILEESRVLLSALKDKHFGGMPVQLGWCFGRNVSLDGLEYHKSSEINVAVTDCVVMLALYNDIHWEPQPWIDSAVVKTFFILSGSVFELYAWCLHFAPLHVSENEGFCILVALPQSTNFGLERKPESKGEAALLFARNKWLLVHPEAEELVKEGAYQGIRGKNLKLKPVL